MPISFNCPACGTKVFIGVDTWEEAIGCTGTCPECQTELIHLAENEVRLLHEYLHQKDPRWPINGKGTKFIDV